MNEQALQAAISINDALVELRADVERLCQERKQAEAKAKRLRAALESSQRNAEEWKDAWYEIGKIVKQYGCENLMIDAVHAWLHEKLAQAQEAARLRQENERLRAALDEAWAAMRWHGWHTMTDHGSMEYLAITHAASALHHAKEEV